MNGIIYCRVSSKEQVEGTSLESQEQACRECARSRQIQVMKVFVGRGESAKFADRPELLELLEFCRRNRGNIQVLLIWKIDRLARNVSDFFNLKALLLKYGVRVVSVSEPIDSNPEGKLLETILAGFAQFDNDIRAMRTIHGMRHKLQEGLCPRNPPLGYRSVTKIGEKKTQADMPDQPVFGLLQKAWREFATGAYTKAEIRRLMTSWGILARRGKPLSPQAIDNLFRNKFYAGVLADYWSREEYEGKHVPMVSKEVFAKVQEVISRRNRSKPHHRYRPEFPLRGSVRCPACRRYMTAGFSRGRSGVYGYYSCGSRRCSGRRSYPADSIHAEFDAFLDHIRLRPENLPKIEEAILCAVSGERARFKAQRTQAEAEIRRLDRQIGQLIQMRAKELLSDEELRQHKTTLLGKKAALEASLVPGAMGITQAGKQLQAILGPLSDLPGAWKGLKEPNLRQRFKHLLIPAGFVAGQIRTAVVGRLFYVFRQFDDLNSSQVPPAGIEPASFP